MTKNSKNGDEMVNEMSNRICRQMNIDNRISLYAIVYSRLPASKKKKSLSNVCMNSVSLTGVELSFVLYSEGEKDATTMTIPFDPPLSSPREFK